MAKAIRVPKIDLQPQKRISCEEYLSRPKCEVKGCLQKAVYKTEIYFLCPDHWNEFYIDEKKGVKPHFGGVTSFSLCRHKTVE